MSHAGDGNELELLTWAHEQRGDPVIGALWRTLSTVACRGPGAEPGEVLRSLQLNGGNTLANVVRRGGVGYAEIAHDVACRLKGVLERGPFRRDDVDSCEAFVLRKMQIPMDELLQQMRKVRARVGGVTLAAQVRATVVDGAVDRAVSAAARAVARRTAKKATEEAARHVVRRAIARALTPLSVVLWGWTLVDLAGPAYRKTIPAVTFVAMLRRVKHAGSSEEEV